MSYLVTDTKYYGEIGDAIRTVNGKSTSFYTPAEMADAILELGGSGTGGNKITFSNSGTYLSFDGIGGDLDVSPLDVSRLTWLANVFKNCSATSINVSEWITTAATSMHEMFYGAANVTVLDCGKFVTDNVTDMGGMFQYSGANYINLAGINTQSVSDMSSMFGISANALKAIIWSQDETIVQPICAKPVQMGISANHVNTYFYVPDSMVSAYQAATNWSLIASKIKGMSELPSNIRALFKYL